MTEQDCRRWEPLVKATARRLRGFLPYGFEFEDLCQYARWALVECLPRVDSQRGTTGSYLRRTLYLQSLKRMQEDLLVRVPQCARARGEGNVQLVALDTARSERGVVVACDVRAVADVSVQWMIARARLSVLEMQALKRRMEGLPCPEKSLDNAFQRARRKLRPIVAAMR